MKFQVRLLLLVSAITTINYFDRSAISFAILPMEKQFHLNQAEFGLILGAFGIGYLGMSFFSGMLVDRFGSVKIWAASALLWSVITLCTGFMQGFWSGLILRALLGMAEAAHFPALLKTVADWLQPSFRARALSFSLLGVPIASLLGAPFITFLIRILGWRGMFFCLGLLGFFWCFVWMLFFQKRSNPHLCQRSMPASPEAPIDTEHPSAWKTILKTPLFQLNCLAFFAFGYLTFVCLLWLPGYLEQETSTSIQDTGYYLMIPWGLSALLLAGGGFLSDRIWKRTQSIWKARNLLIGTALVLCSVFFAVLPFLASLRWVLLILSLGMGVGFFTNSPIYALNSNLFPRHTGTAQGFLSFFFALAGIFGPIATGFLTQRTGSFHAAFFVLSCLCLIAGLSVLLFSRERKRRH